MRFKDRKQAGEKLAKTLKEFKGRDAVVYALPRGGIILGQEVAKEIQAPLDLLIPRKIGHPSMSEYAIAAVTEAGEVVKNEAEVALVDQTWFDDAVETQRKEAKRRRAMYLEGRAAVRVTNKIGIIVDDGIATGLTMKAAIADLKRLDPSMIVIAVPVASKDTTEELKKIVDRVVVLHVPMMFLGAIGSYYDSFEQVTDDEAVTLMKNIK
jgi:predicted phosphoribosyltransferase